MKQASVLESDTSIPLSLKLEKSKTLERDITEKSESNKQSFRQVCDKVDPFLRNEDKPTVENMARLVLPCALNEEYIKMSPLPEKKTNEVSTKFNVKTISYLVYF